jgi:hypothetical protein
MGSENGCAAGSVTGAHAARYYRFADPSGRVHLVDSIDSVPQALRAQAACIEYHDAPSSLPSVIAHAAATPTSYQIFGLGFAAALIAAFVFSRLPGSLRVVSKMVIVVGGVALLAGLYFGWLRRTAQQSADTFAGPGTLLEDAKQAVAKMNARTRAEQAELKEAEQAK